MLAGVTMLIVLSVNFLYVCKGGGREDPETLRFKDVPYDLDVCNFGSSHGLYGFDYEDYEDDYSCFNFAMNSQYPTYDYRILQYYQDHLKEGTIVFLPLTDYMLFGKKQTETEDFASLNKRYYRILPASLIRNYDLETAIMLKCLPSLEADRKDLSDTLLGKKKPEYVSFYESVADYWNRETNYEEAKEDVAERTGIRLLECKEENTEEIEAVYAMIRLCQEKNAVPILITMPTVRLYQEMEADFDPTFHDRYHAIIDRIISDTGVSYLNAELDERFCDDYVLFRDSDHLNHEGARKMTKILFEEIVAAER